MYRTPRRLVALLLTLALSLSLLAPGFAVQEVLETPPVTQTEDVSAAAEEGTSAESTESSAEPDSSAEPTPEASTKPDSSAESAPEPSTESDSSAESAPDSSSEPDSSTGPAPEASSEPDSSTGPAPEASTEPDSSVEPAPYASAEPDSSAEPAPEASDVSDSSAESALTVQQEETPAEIWWQTGKDTYAKKVDYEYNGSERKPAYRVMRDGVQVEVPKTWTEAWYQDEACTVPAKEFVEVGTRWLRLMDGDTVKAEGSCRIIKASQRITAASGTVEKLFKSKSTFALEVKSSGDGALRFVSSDPSVVKVSKKKGVCTMLKPGTASITVTAEETAHFKRSTGTISVTLYKKPKNLGYSKSYKSGKYYRALAAVKLSGTTGQNAVDIALSQLGYREGSKSGQLSGYGRGRDMSNWTEYGRHYGLNHQPWCAIFVNWCAREAGANYAAVPKYCAVRYYHSYFKRKGRFHSWSKVRSGSYKPKKGDIILYAYTKGGVAHHIGYVLSSAYENGRVKVTTVEGNTHDKVKQVSMNFSSRSAGKHDGHYILGVASPKW